MDILHFIETALYRDNLSSAELARRGRFSQASISRALQKLPVIKLGAGRNTVFAWVKEVAGEPLYAINTSGQPQHIAQFYQQPQGRCLLIQGDTVCQFDDIPWFLQSVLPAGFLGRWHVEQLSQSFAFNKNPAHWSSEGHALDELNQCLP